MSLSTKPLGRSLSKIIAALGTGALILFSCAADADVWDLKEISPVMNKTYGRSRNIGLNLGYFPRGAISKYTNYGFSFSLESNESANGWEVVNAQYLQENAQAIKENLVKYYNVPSSELVSVDSIIGTYYKYTPFYMKTLLLNASQLRSQISFLIGGGQAKLSSGESRSFLGLGLQYQSFLTQRVALNFDFRYYSVAEMIRINQQLINVNAGISYGF